MAERTASIAMKSLTYVHGPQRMNPALGNPLTFALEFNFVFLMKCLYNYTSTSPLTTCHHFGEPLT